MALPFSLYMGLCPFKLDRALTLPTFKFEAVLQRQIIWEFAGHDIYISLKLPLDLNGVIGHCLLMHLEFARLKGTS